MLSNVSAKWIYVLCVGEVTRKIKCKNNENVPFFITIQKSNPSIPIESNTYIVQCMWVLVCVHVNIGRLWMA